ncbi:MAG: hypothetical protein WCK01_00870 [Candidatus Uhrbacteria bacterium]
MDRETGNALVQVVIIMLLVGIGVEVVLEHAFGYSHDVAAVSGIVSDLTVFMLVVCAIRGYEYVRKRVQARAVSDTKRRGG